MSAQPPRFAARTQILTDLKISEGARLLFLYLDDLARNQSTCFEKQDRTSAKLGLSRRELQRRVSELIDSCYLEIVRTGRTNLYRFVWGNTTVESHHENEQATVQSHQMRPPVRIAPYIQEKLQEPLTPSGENEPQTQNPDCPECFGLGYMLVQRVIRGQGVTDRQSCACRAGKPARNQYQRSIAS